jgi:hypothetical protein
MEYDGARVWFYDDLISKKKRVDVQQSARLHYLLSSYLLLILWSLKKIQE